MTAEIMLGLIQLGIIEPCNEYEARLASEARADCSPELYEMKRQAMLDKLRELGCIPSEGKPLPRS
jgi:hypothetical protein